MRAPVVVVLLGILAAVHAGPAVAARVTLDARTLDLLEREDPARFRKVSEIIRLASEHGCASAPTILKAKFDVAYARCETLLFMTSNPPQRRLTFKLENTVYDANVTVRSVAGEFVPLVVK
jgi:hypothetical protein